MSEVERIKEDIAKLKEWIKKPSNFVHIQNLKLQLKFQKKLLKQLEK